MTAKPPAPRPVRVASPRDAELAAMRTVARVVDPLPADAQKRVIKWLSSAYQPEMPPLQGPTTSDDD